MLILLILLMVLEVFIFLQAFLRGKIIDSIFTVLYSLQTAFTYLILFNAIVLQSMVGNDVTGKEIKVQVG